MSSPSCSVCLQISRIVYQGNDSACFQRHTVREKKSQFEGVWPSGSSCIIEMSCFPFLSFDFPALLIAVRITFPLFSVYLKPLSLEVLLLIETTHHVCQQTHLPHVLHMNELLKVLQRRLPIYFWRKAQQIRSCHESHGPFESFSLF